MAPPAPALTPGRKVARFVAADPAPSTLQPAADGKLPELQLKEPQERGRKQASGSHPALLAVVLGLSLTASLALLLFDPHTQPQTPLTNRKAQARRVIEEEYFASLDSPAPKEPYQDYLRRAQRAYSCGDRKTEREFYRKVLQQLRAERRDAFESVTGTRARDQQLEQLLCTLLDE